MSAPQTTVEYHVAHAADMDPVVLYRLLRIRVDVFVVEQTALFADLDGRDIDSDTLLAWAQEGDEVLATIRILTEDDHLVIGRVATAFGARGRGLAAELIRRAVDEHGHHELRMEAQERLAGWYGRFGFEVSGPSYVEDDILHVPMTRQATAAP
ncbi:GNAT family N-acetyltransferase [Plantibacter flavus]|uniref:GNAT family N-acetyltransferase n=1 Tax=Plantibacter flavus TaxID=150123 RepID=UPI003F18DEA8